MKYYIMVFFLVCSCSDEPVMKNDDGVKEMLNIIAETQRLSNIDVMPEIIESLGANVNHEVKIVQLDDEVRFSEGSNFICIPHEYQESLNEYLFEYTFWKESLLLSCLNKLELSQISYVQKMEYISKLGLKANLMKERTTSLIIESKNNSIICMTNSKGEVYGRIWSKDLKLTKSFRGFLRNGNNESDVLLRYIAHNDMFAENDR